MRRYRTLLPAAFAVGLLVLAPHRLLAAPRPQPIPATIGNARAYARFLQKVNPQMPRWQREQLALHALRSAWHYHIDANLLVALVTVESSWHTHARSWAGAVGLGQLMPGTAARMGIDPRDPVQNLSGAARYLSEQVQRFAKTHHPYRNAIAAYNAGPKAVVEYGGIPPYYETQHYVVKVTRVWRRIARSVHATRELSLRNPAPDERYWISSTDRIGSP